MRETVLLVDDNPLARMDIAQTLNDAGFDVLEASNSEDALEHVKACEGDIAAIITDIEMPGSLNGCALAWRVSCCTTAAILVVSGVAQPDEDALPTKARFMSKPVSPEILLRELRIALTA